MDANRARDIASTALSLVGSERQRQIDEKGYTVEHDDQHGMQELAAAAAFYLFPAVLDEDVCTTDGENRLHVDSLLELIGRGAWPEIFRDADSEVRFEDDNAALDLRIRTMVRGLALGLAELERLMRMREANPALWPRDD